MNKIFHPLAVLAAFFVFAESNALEAVVKLTPEQEQHIGILSQRPEAISGVQLVRVPARVSLPPHNEYIVSAPQAGLLSKLEVALGMKVAMGQVLAGIQSPSLLSLQRAVLDAAVNLNLARAKLNRDKTLLEEGIIAQIRYQETLSDYERFATALKEAEQMLAAAGVSEADIRSLEQSHRLDSYLNVRSPIDGVVLERMVTTGQRVDLLAPLFRVGKLDELWLDIDVPQERMSELKAGDQVHIEHTGLSARISLIGRNVNPLNQSVQVRAIVEGGAKDIRPGQNVNVQIMHASTDKLFRLPIAALASQEGKDYVFVRVPGGFAARAVAVASKEEHHLVIHEGLNGGEEVAVQGVAALKASWTGIGSED